MEFNVVKPTKRSGYLILRSNDFANLLLLDDKGIRGFKSQNIMFADISGYYDDACLSGAVYMLNNRNFKLPQNPSQRLATVPNAAKPLQRSAAPRPRKKPARPQHGT